MLFITTFLSNNNRFLDTMSSLPSQRSKMYDMNDSVSSNLHQNILSDFKSPPSVLDEFQHTIRQASPTAATSSSGMDHCEVFQGLSVAPDIQGDEGSMGSNEDRGDSSSPSFCQPRSALFPLPSCLVNAGGHSKQRPRRRSLVSFQLPLLSKQDGPLPSGPSLPSREKNAAAKASSDLWWETPQIQEFYRQARRSAKWILMRENNNKSNDNSSASTTSGISAGLHLLYQESTDRTNTQRAASAILQGLTARELLAALTTSSNDTQSDARGLEPFLHPCIKQSRAAHVLGVLMIQRALQNNQETSSSLDSDTMQQVLRTRSLQTSRASRVLARLLAHGDSMQVTRLLRQELLQEQANNDYEERERSAAKSFGNASASSATSILLSSS